MAFETTFTKKINELDSIYSFTENEKSQLTQKLVSTHLDAADSEGWNKVWYGYAKENRVGLATRFALKKCASKGDAIAKLSSSEYELSQELKKYLREVDAHVTIDEGTPLDDQVHKLDGKLREYFERHHKGPQAKALINALKEPSSIADRENRVAKWSDPLYIPQLIARCQWLNSTRSVVLEMEKKHQRWQAPSINNSCKPKLEATA